MEGDKAKIDMSQNHVGLIGKAGNEVQKKKPIW